MVRAEGVGTINNRSWIVSSRNLQLPSLTCLPFGRTLGAHLSNKE